MMSPAEQPRRSVGLAAPCGCCATKSLLVRSRRDAQFAIAVCAKTEKVDLHRLARQCGWRKGRLATIVEIDQLFGRSDVISPIGHDELTVVIDATLLEFATVLVGADDQHAVLEMDPRDLQRRTHAIAAPIALSRSRWE